MEQERGAYSRHSCVYIVARTFLETLRNSGDIGGAKVGEADDILLYVTKPRVTLPNIIRKIKKYGELSIFKINPIKTENWKFIIKYLSNLPFLIDSMAAYMLVNLASSPML